MHPHQRLDVADQSQVLTQRTAAPSQFSHVERGRMVQNQIHSRVSTVMSRF